MSRPRPSICQSPARLLLWGSCLVFAFAHRGSPGEGLKGIAQSVWVISERPLSDDQIEALRDVDSLLIMLPGVSSGDMEESCGFLDSVRIRGKYPVAVFYDWQPWNPGRKLVSPTAVGPAASRLVRLCEAFRNTGTGQKHIDLLAHSAGTVVVNKAALSIAETGSPVRFRHVLFLGTALDADEPLGGLKRVSSGVLNAHSAYDKVNRNINDRLGHLSSLDGGSYRNLRMDRTMGGRIVRHYVFLASNPENWFQYGSYLATGQWPDPNPDVPGDNCGPDDLHRLALWVLERREEHYPEVKAMLPVWLGGRNPEVRYYAALLAGRIKVKSLAPVLQTILADETMPVYLRKEIYQAFGNFEDGVYVDFLRSARKEDEDCAEELRDVLRDLKRKRIRPVRGPRTR